MSSTKKLTEWHDRRKNSKSVFTRNQARAEHQCNETCRKKSMNTRPSSLCAQGIRTRNRMCMNIRPQVHEVVFTKQASQRIGFLHTFVRSPWHHIRCTRRRKHLKGKCSTPNATFITDFDALTVAINLGEENLNPWSGHPPGCVSIVTPGNNVEDVVTVIFDSQT